MTSRPGAVPLHTQATVAFHGAGRRRMPVFVSIVVVLGAGLVLASASSLGAYVGPLEARRDRAAPRATQTARHAVLSLRGGGQDCGNRDAKDVMMGWKDEGEADQDIVNAMLGLRSAAGDEERTLLTPLAVDDAAAGVGFKEVARYAISDLVDPRAEDEASPAVVGSGVAGLAELKEGEIRRPDTDTRAYKHVTLANGLQAVLVSDPDAHSAAAALCVSVGQLDDPPSVQGLAHFLEHMLFLGTEKFPDESNFDQFCAESAGYSNAWTSLDHTMYHFIVAEKKLREALDRFAAFFSCPLFSPAGTEREMKAVDSEHTKNLQDDDRREYQLLRSTASASHPMSRFGAGNLHTLLDEPREADPPTDVRAQLLALHEQHYTADRMRLAVLGREPVEELETWVTEFFSPIRSCGGEAAAGAGGEEDGREGGSRGRAGEGRVWMRQTPFDAGWKQAFLIKPVAERRVLSLSRPLLLQRLPHSLSAPPTIPTPTHMHACRCYRSSSQRPRRIQSTEASRRRSCPTSSATKVPGHCSLFSRSSDGQPS